MVFSTGYKELKLLDAKKQVESVGFKPPTACWGAQLTPLLRSSRSSQDPDTDKLHITHITKLQIRCKLHMCSFNPLTPLQLDHM